MEGQVVARDGVAREEEGLRKPASKSLMNAELPMKTGGSLILFGQLCLVAQNAVKG